MMHDQATNQPRVIRVAIVGGGISGIAQAIRLKESLGDSVAFTIYERSTQPGGVWRDSTWPGAGVDIPIHLYQLYSSLNPSWTTKFAQRPEVMAYWKSLIKKHALGPSFRFSHCFTSSAWDAATQSHTLVFSRPGLPDLTATADVIISAAGALNTPIFPKLEGMDTFLGEQFHSSRWQDDVDLRGKRVAIVGNGSSGIQVVPNIVGLEGIRVTQFFRSPGYFTPKVSYDYTSLEKFAFKWVPGLQRVYRWYLFYQLDAASLSKGTGSWSSALRKTHTERLITYLQAKAPAKYLSILTPTYPLHCKRVAYNAGWLESLHLPNVLLLNTPITSVTPAGLRTSDGVEHPFDVIVWATGFDVSGTGVGINEGVVGEDGQELRKVWEDKEGAEGYLAVAVPKFPNYFIVLGPNAISMSWGYTLGNQTEFIARLIKGLYTKKLSSIAPKTSVSKAYNLTLQDRLQQTVLVSTACNAWYRYRGYGKVIAPSGFTATELWLRTRRVRWEDWEARSLETAEVVEVRSARSWNPLSWIGDALAGRLEGYLVRLSTE